MKKIEPTFLSDLEKSNMQDYAISLSSQEGHYRGMEDIQNLTPLEIRGPSLSGVNFLGEGGYSGEPHLNFVDEDKTCATNPSHYQNADKKYEHRFVAKAWDLEYYLSAATKYIARCGKKASVGMSDVAKEIQDLEKSIVYIQFRIDELKGE
tara:strand:- start:439 stop:891 length:453 start_codon:yes stop_codon:yes gene_type:complete